MNFIKTTLISATLVGGLFSSFNALAQDPQKALAHMDLITEQYEDVTQKTWDYTSAVARDKGAKRIENKRQELLTTIKNAERSVKKIAPYNAETTYRDAVVEYLNLSYTVINEDYGQIMDMQEIAEQSYDLMEAYMLAQELASERLSEASESLQEVEKGFAADNNITLVESENKTLKKLAVADKVFDHYNEVYLIFFKSYKQEMYLIDALGRKDVNAIEQNKNALAKYAAEGLEKLASLKPYDSDPTIVATCKKMLEFYVEETEKQIPEMTAFLVSQEEMTKIKAAMESKKKSEITQQDVDTYNKAIEDFNNGVATYNKNNEFLNDKRGKLIDSYNDSGKRFLDRHIPR